VLPVAQQFDLLIFLKTFAPPAQVDVAPVNHRPRKPTAQAAPGI